MTHSRFWAFRSKKNEGSEEISSIELAWSERRKTVARLLPSALMATAAISDASMCSCTPVFRLSPPASSHSSFPSFTSRELDAWNILRSFVFCAPDGSKSSMGHLKNPRRRKGRNTSGPYWRLHRLWMHRIAMWTSKKYTTKSHGKVYVCGSRRQFCYILCSDFGWYGSCTYRDIRTKTINIAHRIYRFFCYFLGRSLVTLAFFAHRRKIWRVWFMGLPIWDYTIISSRHEPYHANFMGCGGQRPGFTK